MIPGFSIETLLALHVAVSLIGIASGLVALPALAAGRWLGHWHAVFLVTTAATSITGFLFPFSGITPALVVGAISVLTLVIAFAALYAFTLRGWARPAYVVSATFALYLNLFVLIVQSFLKVPVLQPMAPTQTEAPFVAAQALLLAASMVLGATAVIGSHGRRCRCPCAEVQEKCVAVFRRQCVVSNVGAFGVSGNTGNAPGKE